jgi:hypothetical protein
VQANKISAIETFLKPLVSHLLKVTQELVAYTCMKDHWRKRWSHSSEERRDENAHACVVLLSFLKALLHETLRDTT